MPTYCSPQMTGITLVETTSKNISFMSLDLTALNVNIVPNIMTDLGVYNIKILVTLTCPIFQPIPAFDNTQIKYVKQPGLAVDW